MQQHCCGGVDHHHRRRRSPRRFLEPSLETTVLFQSPAFVTHLLYLPRFEDPLRDWLLWLLLVIVAESSERFYPSPIQASLDLSVDRSFTLRRLLRPSSKGPAIDIAMHAVFSLEQILAVRPPGHAVIFHLPSFASLFFFYFAVKEDYAGNAVYYCFFPVL